MDDASSVERIAYELASDSFTEGVRYIEVRLAPQLHIRENFQFEQVMAAVAFRDAGGARIVGFDIAGSERGYPASNHREAYEYAHRNFLHKTVHAGEAYGAESIFTAITKCHADRIGHGLLLFSETDIADPDIVDRAKYVRDLANYIADRRITVEVCLTSNMQTNPRFADIRNHSLALMLEHGLSVTFCTDNRLVSNTSVCSELRLALDNFRISASRFKDIVIYGFKRSFRFGSYADKRTYVRSCIDWYEKVAREHGVEY
jgi:adenosine deaminase